MNGFVWIRELRNENVPKRELICEECSWLLGPAVGIQIQLFDYGLNVIPLPHQLCLWRAKAKDWKHTETPLMVRRVTHALLPCVESGFEVRNALCRHVTQWAVTTAARCLYPKGFLSAVPCIPSHKKEATACMHCMRHCTALSVSYDTNTSGWWHD